MSEREQQPPDPLLPLEPPIPMPIPMRQSSEKRARVLVVTSITHQVPGYEARKPEQARFTQELTSTDDRYEIRLTATTEWMEIQTGHISLDKVVLLHLLNKTPVKGPPRFNIKGRGPEQQVEWKVLIIGLLVGDEVYPFCSLAPGQDLPISPMGLENYRIRAEEGECKFNLFAVPM